MNIVSNDSESNYSTKFFAGLGSCAIGLNLSARFCGVLSDGLDGALAMEGLKLRGSRRCEPPSQMQNGRSSGLPFCIPMPNFSDTFLHYFFSSFFVLYRYTVYRSFGICTSWAVTV